MSVAPERGHHRRRLKTEGNRRAEIAAVKGHAQLERLAHLQEPKSAVSIVRSESQSAVSIVRSESQSAVSIVRSTYCVDPQQVKSTTRIVRKKYGPQETSPH